MLVRPNERVPIARLLRFLEQGERLAYECARAQAALAPETGMRRFLLGQARQEYVHAGVFHTAVAWLEPCHLGACPLLLPLERYRARLVDAIRHGRFVESILAEQIVLEGLGEAILKRIEAGLVKRGAVFGRLRRILVHQEEAHHAFGRRVLGRAMAAGETSPELLRALASDYMALTDEIVMTLGDQFEAVDEDPGAYVADARRHLPSWLTA